MRNTFTPALRIALCEEAGAIQLYALSENSINYLFYHCSRYAMLL
jgi:hypothetical protein